MYRLGWFVLCGVSAGLTGLALAQSGPEESPKENSKAEAARVAALIAAELKQWDLRVVGDKERAVPVRAEPVLRWSNPVVGREVHGGTYLAMLDGRPEAAFSIYKWTSGPVFNAEMVSLSSEALVLRTGRGVVWQPKPPGVVLADVPDAPPVGKTAAERLRQMRALARGFSAQLLDRRSNRQGEVQTLRLLPQPLDRYDSRRPDVTDGAIFAFVLATDPEVLLLLEARPTDAGPRWQYGLARMNQDELWVRHGDREIWHVPVVKAWRDSTTAYYLAPLPEPK